jgi:hypothetical protein
MRPHWDRNWDEHMDERVAREKARLRRLDERRKEQRRARPNEKHAAFERALDAWIASQIGSSASQLDGPTSGKRCSFRLVRGIASTRDT